MGAKGSAKPQMGAMPLRSPLSAAPGNILASGLHYILTLIR